MPPQPSPAGLRFWSLPVDASRHGPALDQHLLLNLWIALALLLLLHILLIAGLSSGGATRGPIHKLTLEYLPLLGFCALFAWLGLRAQHLWAAQRYTGADPAAMQVEVTGMQFVWYFRYPGQDATFGRTDLALADAARAIPSAWIRRTRTAETTSSLANSCCPPVARSTSRCERRTSSTASPFPRCA